MRRTDGELILFWTLPAVALIWISAFFLFPGFLHPMSPTMSAAEVADKIDFHLNEFLFAGSVHEDVD